LLKVAGDGNAEADHPVVGGDEYRKREGGRGKGLAGNYNSSAREINYYTTDYNERSL